MTPPDPRAIRALAAQSGLSGADACAILGVSRRTWGNWIAGTHRMPAAAYELLCRLAAEGPEISAAGRYYGQED